MQKFAGPRGVGHERHICHVKQACREDSPACARFPCIYTVHGQQNFTKARKDAHRAENGPTESGSKSGGRRSDKLALSSFLSDVGTKWDHIEPVLPDRVTLVRRNDRGKRGGTTVKGLDRQQGTAGCNGRKPCASDAILWAQWTKMRTYDEVFWGVPRSTRLTARRIVPCYRAGSS